MKQILNSAIVLAAKVHDGQFDRGGNPYILHCLKVMHYLKSDDEELMCIAVLHDSVEDGNITIWDLDNAGMSDRVVQGIIKMTKVTGETYDEYIDHLMLNVDAMKVKKADLRHNMDIRRLKGVTDKDMLRLQKYARTYAKIDQKLKELGHG